MSNLKIKLSKDTILDFDINDRLTIISGESATGKTYLMDCIENIIQMDSKESFYDKRLLPNKFLLIRNERDVIDVKEAVNKIIIIDRYDIFPDKLRKIIKNKMKEQNNTWIVMSRHPDFKVYGSATIKHLKCREENGKKILYLAIPY